MSKDGVQKREFVLLIDGFKGTDVFLMALSEVGIRLTTATNAPVVVRGRAEGGRWVGM